MGCSLCPSKPEQVSGGYDFEATAKNPLVEKFKVKYHKENPDDLSFLIRQWRRLRLKISYYFKLCYNIYLYKWLILLTLL